MSNKNQEIYFYLSEELCKIYKRLLKNFVHKQVVIFNSEFKDIKKVLINETAYIIWWPVTVPTISDLSHGL